MSSAQRATAGAHLAIFCVGLYAASFGPILPFFSRDLRISLDTAGLLLTALFAGSIVASTGVALRLHRHDTRATAVAGLALIFAGLVALAWAPGAAPAFAAAALVGVGDGLLVAAVHQLVAQTATDVPTGISRLNLWFALGAIAGPLWAGALLETTDGYAPVYFGISAVVVLAAAVLFASGREPLPTGPAPPIDAVPPTVGLVALMGLVLFFYVGAEIGLGAWVSSYAERAAGAGVFEGALVTAGYWGALAAGRFATGALLARGAAAGPLLCASIAAAGLSSLVLVLAGGSLGPGAAAAFATGLFFGPVWPVSLAIAARGGHPGVSAVLVTVGNAGGLVFPWLQGKVLVSDGPERGIIVTVVLCGLMLVLAVLALRRRPQPQAV
jgi:fucose permease